MSGHDVLPDISTEGPPSRPFTPNEQMDIMRAFEDHEISESGEPTNRDEEVGCTFLWKFINIYVPNIMYH